MNKTRLLLLADALETRIPRDKFDLANWRSGNHDGKATDAELLHNCNTAGCAVGWACALPEFQSEGLHWDYDRPAFNDHGRLQSRNWEAVEEFFEINYPDAERLFDSYSYVAADRKDPLAVARRIRGFVSQGKAA